MAQTYRAAMHDTGNYCGDDTCRACNGEDKTVDQMCWKSRIECHCGEIIETRSLEDLNAWLDAHDEHRPLYAAGSLDS